MITVGIDIIEVVRIENSLQRLGQRFLDRIFTAQEQIYCQSRPDRLAGRFAIKEAVGKALGIGIGDVRWQEIEVVNNKLGRPELVLHGDAKKLAESMGLIHWSISMSHSESNAVGMAVALSTGIVT